MIVIGLTGSIGMGKTTVADMFAAEGIAVLDSDKVVHALLAGDEAVVRKVAKLFPEAYKKDRLDRKEIGKAVFTDPRKLKKLEAILHPAVRKAQREFLKAQKRKKAKAAMLDIPLLYETKAEERMDCVVVVTAPAAVQKARVMKRPGMTEDKFRRILARQMPDAKKRKMADFIVDNGGTKAESRRQVKQIIKKILAL